MKLIDLPVKPFTVENALELNHNHIRVSVDYDKGVKGPVVTLQAIEVTPDSYRMVIFASPSGRVVLERGWKMNNAKRMAAARDQVLAEIAGKRGDSWAAVEKILTEAKTELLEPVAA